MKLFLRHSLFCTALALFLTGTFAAAAQETPKTDDKTIPPPAATATPAAPAAPAAPTPPVEAGKSSELHRIDGDTTTTVVNTPNGSTTVTTTSTPEGRRVERTRVRTHTGDAPRLGIGQDARLDKGESADAVVAVFGSATSAGEVGDAVVSVLGHTRVTGPVGDAAVAVLGSTSVNSKIGGAVVAVLGNVELGPDTEVGGDVVCIGGKVTRDPKAVVHGQVVNVGIGPSFSGDGLNWIANWFRECALKGRLLWVGPNLGWAWGLAGTMLFLYIIIALVFRGGVDKGVTHFETRPGSSILAAILTMLLSPVLTVLLCITFVGAILVPFIGTALMLATLFGKAILLAWLGRRFTKFFGDGPLNHPAFAVLIGGVIVMGLYLIPIVAVLTYMVIKVLGLGIVVHMLVNSSKREKPGASRPPVAPMPAPALGVVAATPMAEGAAVPLASATPPVAVPASTLPRAGFWIRIGALLIDLILVTMVITFLTHSMPRALRPDVGPFVLGILAIYGAIMWKLKGTTIGGIVCGLKVVRPDGRPVDWPTVVVRALSCFLSLIVCGLGFIWVVIDDDKQSWHDKIAGTTVVRVPRGTSLV